MANEKKKLQKAALGLQDSDDEDIEGDIDQQIETMLAPKRIVKEVKASAIGLPNLTGLSNFILFYSHGAPQEFPLLKDYFILVEYPVLFFHYIIHKS